MRVLGGGGQQQRLQAERIARRAPLLSKYLVGACTKLFMVTVH